MKFYMKTMLATAMALAGSMLFGASHGQVALHTWWTSAEFKDIEVTSLDGHHLWRGMSNFDRCIQGNESHWEYQGGVLRQTREDATWGGTLTFGDQAWTDYVLKVKARKISGKEGFILQVRKLNDGQCFLANYGGWLNRESGIEYRDRHGIVKQFRKSTPPIETGRWYGLEVICQGSRVTMKLDGRSLFENVDLMDAKLIDEPNTIVIDAGKAKFPVPEDMWGIFLEDVDCSLDGGLYAELVRNRSFEDGNGKDPNHRTALGFWSALGHAELTLDTSKPLSNRNRQCGCVKANPGAGVANDGYFGIAVKDRAKYRLSVMLRGDMRGPLEVSLASLGTTYAKGVINGIDGEWRNFNLELVANGTYPETKLVFRAPHGGTFYLDCVSLFPCDTYGKSGIFRRDLMERLAALRPSFMRFPGGCWVEGNTMADAYRWKRTIGPIWERPTQWNLWKSWATHGIGFHEYLQLCEELNAKALFCINAGISHKETVPMEKMDEFVQDALDCIEYANGPTTSKWGAMRAANGHPQPFNLAYLQIGNENGGPKYEARYELIAKAVRAKHPEIQLVFDGPWSFNKANNTWDVNAPKNIRDDHFYRSPDWFFSHANLYSDHRERQLGQRDFQVFVGEYAVTSDVGRWGSVRAAMGEAAFMCGFERNADVVRLASYAPLFANPKHMVWSPNLIYPMTDGNFVNPSWYVQKLFSENRGKEVLNFKQTSRMMTTKDGKRCQAVAASVVRNANGTILVKAVNCSNVPQALQLSIAGTKILEAKKTWFTGPNAEACNSPFNRETLKEVSCAIPVSNGTVEDHLPPLSITVFRLTPSRP